MRIFTHFAISPSTSLRQLSNRYAIRAGRNLPDKGFRSSLLRSLNVREVGALISGALLMSP
jgi:hypothetical protein